MIYHHPLACLIGMEGLALLRAWAGDEDYDEQFVMARLDEVRMLLADEALSGHPGVFVEKGATDSAYRQWSATYDDPANGLFDLDTPVVDEILDSVSIGTALDAACGTGRLTSRLVDRGHRVIGVDSSLDMLDRARRMPTADLAVGDLRQLPLADNQVDLVLTSLALTHVPDLRPVFAEFARVLRGGGHLIISDVHHELVLRGSVVKAVRPNGQAQMAATHRHTTGDILRAALATGFSVRRYEERPQREEDIDTPAEEPTPEPESTDELGRWPDWPWTLLGLVPPQPAPRGTTRPSQSGTSDSTRYARDRAHDCSPRPRRSRGWAGMASG